MRKLAILVGLLALTGGAEARGVRVGGHVNSTGVYVAPHVRTAPDRSLYNNYATKGNTNPYTGKAGAVEPFKIKPIRP